MHELGSKAFLPLLVLSSDVLLPGTRSSYICPLCWLFYHLSSVYAEDPGGKLPHTSPSAGQRHSNQIKTRITSHPIAIVGSGTVRFLEELQEIPRGRERESEQASELEMPNMWTCSMSHLPSLNSLFYSQIRGVFDATQAGVNPSTSDQRACFLTPTCLFSSQPLIHNSGSFITAGIVSAARATPAHVLPASHTLYSNLAAQMQRGGAACPHALARGCTPTWLPLQTLWEHLPTSEASPRD